jgi:hypothetical protein
MPASVDCASLRYPVHFRKIGVPAVKSGTAATSARWWRCKNPKKAKIEKEIEVDGKKKK